jgi:NADH-quinone oxidoreductase subunit J
VNDLVFWLLALLLLLGALGTVMARSLYRAAYCLGGTLVVTAFFYLMLTAPVLGAIQILLYTGGVLTLVVFALVMTEGSQSGEVRWRRPLMAAAASVALYAVLAAFSLGVGAVPAKGGLESGRDAGAALFTTYLVPFELLSVLLLGALFGALLIARRDETP